MEEFYYAAASYFERTPWKHVMGEVPIRVICRGLNLPARYAIVLGRTGVTLGLTLYDDLVRSKPTASGRATLKGSAGPACFLPTKCWVKNG